MARYNQNLYGEIIAGNNPPDRYSDGRLKWSIATVGCLVTSIANALPTIGMEEIDPSAVNDRLKQAGLFGSGDAYLRVEGLPQAFEGLEVSIYKGYNQTAARFALDDPSQAVILGVDYRPQTAEVEQHFVLLVSEFLILDPDGGVDRPISYFGNKIFSTIILKNNDMSIQQTIIDAINAQDWGSEEEKQARLNEARAGDWNNLMKYGGSEVRGWLKGEQTKTAELRQELATVKKSAEGYSAIYTFSTTNEQDTKQSQINVQMVKDEEDAPTPTKPKLPITESTFFSWVETNLTALGLGGVVSTPLINELWTASNDTQKVAVIVGLLLIIGISYYLTTIKKKNRL